MEKCLPPPTSSALTTVYWGLPTLNANKNDQHTLYSGVASYGALGHVPLPPPRLPNLRANYPSIV